MDADQDREKFREHLRESDRYFDADDVDRANAESEAAEGVLAPWEAEGREVEFLTPLLEASETRGVRLAAAAGLYYTGHQDAAVPVLEEISNGPGREAVTAFVVLGERTENG
jgi:hypothetical protein